MLHRSVEAAAICRRKRNFSAHRFRIDDSLIFPVTFRFSIVRATMEPDPALAFVLADQLSLKRTASPRPSSMLRKDWGPHRRDGGPERVNRRISTVYARFMSFVSADGVAGASG